jgi:predicted DCC family thiol-disulfide oxidoreductase YuxK
MEQQKLILLYDGHCALCNYAVKKVLKWDKKDQVLLSPLFSPKSQDLLKQHKIPVKTDSIVLIQGSKAFLKSQAVAELLKLIRPYYFFGFLLRLFPLSISNFMYRIVAKNRYRWFGKYDTCPVLPGKFKNKLLK